MSSLRVGIGRPDVIQRIRYCASGVGIGGVELDAQLEWS